MAEKPTSSISNSDYLFYINKLTRFFNPEKPLELFYEKMILKYFNQFNKKTVQELTLIEKEKLVKNLWDLNLTNTNEFFNHYLKFEAQQTYKNPNLHNLNIYGALEKIENEPIPKALEQNILRLRILKKTIDDNTENINEQTIENRNRYRLLYPLNCLVIAEGITEEILLPAFAKIYGHDFSENGVNLLSTGGKNRALKMYKQYAAILNIPIFVLLDSDAENIASEINEIKRTIDKVCLIKEGEFEDLISKKLIIKTMNNYFQYTTKVVEDDFSAKEKMTVQLERIWREKALGGFEKAKFATIIAHSINSKSDITPSLKNILDRIQTLPNRLKG